MSTRVLFVCLGNICRSPTAHAVFDKMVQDAALQADILVDSAGTGDWHLGQPPDARATAAARVRGYDLSALRARLVTAGDFQAFDYVLAMDRQNLSNLRAMAPSGYSGKLQLFLDFHPAAPVREVPDPYYGGADGFDHVLDLVEAASRGLLSDIVA